MPQGDKSSYTDKQKRQAEHIEESYREKGVSEDEAESRASVLEPLGAAPSTSTTAAARSPAAGASPASLAPPAASSSAQRQQARYTMAERIGIVKTDKQRGGAQKSPDPSRERQPTASSGDKHQGGRQKESGSPSHNSQRKSGKNE